MANLIEEICQKSGKKYVLVCCSCSTIVASLLENERWSFPRIYVYFKEFLQDYCIVSKFVYVTSSTTWKTYIKKQVLRKYKSMAINGKHSTTN